jgi:hypothetical protein
LLFQTVIVFHSIALPVGIRRVSPFQKKIADLPAMPGIADVDFEIPLSRELARPADFS